jgi:hypothetical protein
MTESTRGERLKLITEDPPGQQLDQCRPPQIDHQLEPDIGEVIGAALLCPAVAKRAGALHHGRHWLHVNGPGVA